MEGKLFIEGKINRNGKELGQRAIATRVFTAPINYFRIFSP